MWIIYILIPLSIAIGIYFLIKYRKVEEPIVEASPEQRYIVIEIDNTVDNYHKKFLLEKNQKIVIFKNKEYITSINCKEFSIENFIEENQISKDELELIKYHFYIFNGSPIYNLSATTSDPIRSIDAKHEIPIAVQPKIKISLDYLDVSTFFESLLMFRKRYTYQVFFKEIGAYLEANIANSIIQFCYENKVSFTVLDYYLDELEAYISNMINEDIKTFGLKIKDLEINSIELVSSNDLKKLSDLMLNKHKYSLLNYSYYDEKRKELMDKIDYKKKMNVNIKKLDDEVNLQ